MDTQIGIFPQRRLLVRIVDGLTATSVRPGRIAEARLVVELEKEDAARPRTVEHPQIARFVVQDGGVDAANAVIVVPFILAIDIAAQLGAVRIARDRLVIVKAGTASLICRSEAREHDKAVELVWPRDVVRRHQKDGGTEVGTVTAHGIVEAPLLHDGIVDDIGRPEIALDRGCIRITGPSGSRFEDLRVVGGDRRRTLFIEGGRERDPALHVIGIGVAELRAEEEVDLLAALARLGIGVAEGIRIGDDDRGIVHGDRAARAHRDGAHADGVADGADVVHHRMALCRDRLEPGEHLSADRTARSRRIAALRTSRFGSGDRLNGMPLGGGQHRSAEHADLRLRTGGAAARRVFLPGNGLRPRLAAQRTGVHYLARLRAGRFRLDSALVPGVAGGLHRHRLARELLSAHGAVDDGIVRPRQNAGRGALVFAHGSGGRMPRRVDRHLLARELLSAAGAVNDGIVRPR